MIRKYIDQQQGLLVKPYMIWNYRCCHVYIYEFLSLSYPAGSLRKTPQPPADGLVPLGRCGGLPWAPWALAWHLAWLSLPWRRGMRVTPTPFLRWLPGRWMTVQCSCWKNRQKYQKDAISGWGLNKKRKGWHGTWMVVSFAKIFLWVRIWAACFMKSPSKKAYQYIFGSLIRCTVLLVSGLTMVGTVGWPCWQGIWLLCLISIFLLYIFFLDPWTQRKFRLMIATSSILKQLFKCSSVAMFSPRIPFKENI